MSFWLLAISGPELGGGGGGDAADAWWQGPGVVVAFMAVGVFVCLLAMVFGNRCPNCRRRRAFNRTGKRRSADNGTRLDEYRCRHCNHTEWKEHDIGGFTGPD